MISSTKSKDISTILKKLFLPDTNLEKIFLDEDSTSKTKTQESFYDKNFLLNPNTSDKVNK
jgi:hypothetical protein